MPLIGIKAIARPRLQGRRRGASMIQHAVIVGHPNQNSLTASLAAAYADHARSLGDEVVVRDLYAIKFNPCLDAAEIPRGGGFRPGDDVSAERVVLKHADVFALFYPLWFNAPPAIIVGYIQRVFGMGFGYGAVHDGGNQPLLGKRRLISFSTSGAPKGWLEQEGGWSALRNTFDHHFANVCGMEVVDHVHFGNITDLTRPDVIQRHIEATKAAVETVSGISRV
jgi:NAD(P)H dehydrogenase (quinone)